MRRVVEYPSVFLPSMLARRVKPARGAAGARVAVTVAVILVAGLMMPMLLRRFTDSMLFYPRRGQWRTPAALGIAYEEIWLDSQGDRIQAWWMPGGGSGPAILMFHGNAGTIADRLDNVRLMIDRLEVGVFLLEYPGYGDSTGRPSEKSLLAAGDAALTATRTLAPDRHLVLFGRSLGSAVASHLAAQEPIDGLIVESGFTTLADLARAVGFPFARPLLPYRFAAIESMSRVSAPVLVVHGDRDEIVPYAMGKELYAAATAARTRRFHTVVGGRHNDTVNVGGDEYWRVWREFLSQLEADR